MPEPTAHGGAAFEGEHATGILQVSPVPTWTADLTSHERGQGAPWVARGAGSRDKRRGRQLAVSIAYPGKRLPLVTRYLIAAYSRPGQIVAHLIAGIALTVVDAMHPGWHGFGIGYEACWAELAVSSLRHITAHGASGTAVNAAAARQLLPQHMNVIIVSRTELPAPLGSAATKPGQSDTGTRNLKLASVPDCRGQITGEDEPRSPARLATAEADHKLDQDGTPRVDRCRQPAHPAIIDARGGAIDLRPHPGREPGRTPDPCPPHSRSTPAPPPSDTPDHPQPTHHHTPHPQHGPSNTAGRR